MLAWTPHFLETSSQSSHRLPCSIPQASEADRETRVFSSVLCLWLYPIFSEWSAVASCFQAPPSPLPQFPRQSQVLSHLLSYDTIRKPHPPPGQAWAVRSKLECVHLKARVPGGLKHSRLRTQAGTCFSPNRQHEGRYRGTHGSPVFLPMSGPSLSASHQPEHAPHPLCQPLVLPRQFPDELPGSDDIC